MGRHAKTIAHSGLNLDARALGYYSTPGFVANFIADTLLALNPDGQMVLDPAVGKEELLPRFFAREKIVDAFDVHRFEHHYHSKFHQQNFIEYCMDLRDAPEGQAPLSMPYDYYIMNPPYNCHEVDFIRHNKQRLRRHFADVGVLNMYSLFLAATIDMAKDGALIGAIVSDSFMHNTLHAGLRHKIFQQCSVHHLLLCPINLFWQQKADIRTAIVILQKGTQYQGKVQCLQRQLSVPEFEHSLLSRKFSEHSLNDLTLAQSNGRSTLIVDVAPSIRRLFHTAPPLGSLYPCLTGISTGNDRQYLSKSPSAEFTVPFYKNPGRRRFFAEADSYLPSQFLQIADSNKTFIVRNRSYLFQEGISCSSMGVQFSAAYRPAGTTFGVNANIFPGKEDLWWLIAFLNSSLVLYMVRAVIIRSNMITSGYVARIPLVPVQSVTRQKLADIALAAFEDAKAGKSIERHVDTIDGLLFAELNLPEADEVEIRAFRSNLSRKV